LAIGVAAAAAIGISVDQGGHAAARRVALAAARPSPRTALLAVGSLDGAADWHRSVRQPSLVYHPPVVRPRHQSAPASTPKADAIRVSSTTTTPLTTTVNQSSPTSSSSSTPSGSSTPVDSSGSVQSAPVQSAPVQSAPVQSAPVRSAPVDSAPVQPATEHPTSGSGSGGGSGGSGTASGGG
jgi:hypothetical protein